jgi:hypothetical protein
MPDLPIECTIDDAESKVEVGSGKKDTNKIVVNVKNKTSQAITFSGFGAQGEFSIAFSIGTKSENLVAPSEESTAITIQAPNQWTSNPYNNVNGQATWSFKLPKPVLAVNAAAQLIVTKFESHTDPGNAKITISAKVSGYDNFQTTPPLEVKKETKGFDLLYFTADPPYIITDDDRANFKLEWNAIEAGKAVLYGNNAQLEQFEEGKGKFESGQKFTFTGEKPSFTTIYKLVATDKKNETNRKEEQVTVQVLAPGWHKVAFFRYGNPSMLCNMDNAYLYGIFIKEGKAGLYSAKYPYAAWTLVNNDVPSGMETSPAVCFKSKLWLVGGSSADSNVCNNEICCYDGGEWKRQKSVGWTARMGHACVVFKEKLWVLGGFGEKGSSLNDVWAAELNGEELNWNQINPPTKETDPNRWEPRCMFAAVVFKEKIWLYGGVDQPFGSPLKNIWSFSGEGQWQNYEVNPPDGEPIACTLQVIKNKLNLLAALRREKSVVARKCALDEGQQLWRSSEIPETAWLDQAENTFRLISVDYGGLIYLIWQDYKIYKAASGQLFLNIYLP